MAQSRIALVTSVADLETALATARALGLRATVMAKHDARDPRRAVVRVTGSARRVLVAARNWAKA